MQATASGAILAGAVSIAVGAAFGFKHRKTRQVAISGERGEYRVVGVPAGDVELTIEYTGYVPARTVVRVPAGGVARSDVELRSSLSAASDLSATEVAEVVVVGAREGDARAIMEQRASMNIVNTLKKMVL